MDQQIPRAHERKRILWTGKLHHGDQVLDCQVLDLSAGGARIRTAKPWTASSAVVLVCDHLGPLRAEVRWQRANYAGIRFLEDASFIEKRLRRKVTPPEHDAASSG